VRIIGAGAGQAPQYRLANRSARRLAYHRHFASLPTSRRFLLTSPCFFMARCLCKEYHTIERRPPCGLRARPVPERG
jgi:hypothetical protein